MIKIKFNNSSTYQKATFSRLNEHVIVLKGVESNTSGFKTFRLNEQPLGDFSDYTTIYRVLDDEIQLSNDGSVYVPPVEPTPEELEMRNRQTKIASLKQNLANTDYVVIKIAEGEATKEEYAEVIESRKAWREEIRSLEA